MSSFQTNNSNEYNAVPKYVLEQSFKYPDDVLHYLKTKLTDADIYMLALIYVYVFDAKNGDNDGLPLQFLHENKEHLKIKLRKYTDSLSRLEVTGLIVETRQNRFVSYSPTIRGEQMLDKLAIESALFNVYQQELVAEMENMKS